MSRPPHAGPTPNIRRSLRVRRFSNREFLGDSLPIAWPNLGPEIFSVFYGCPVEFGDYGTSWTAPDSGRLGGGGSGSA